MLWDALSCADPGLVLALLRPHNALAEGQDESLSDHSLKTESAVQPGIFRAPQGSEWERIIGIRATALHVAASWLLEARHQGDVALQKSWAEVLWHMVFRAKASVQGAESILSVQLMASGQCKDRPWVVGRSGQTARCYVLTHCKDAELLEIFDQALEPGDSDVELERRERNFDDFFGKGKGKAMWDDRERIFMSDDDFTEKGKGKGKFSVFDQERRWGKGMSDGKGKGAEDDFEGKGHGNGKGAEHEDGKGRPSGKGKGAEDEDFKGKGKGKGEGIRRLLDMIRMVMGRNDPVTLSGLLPVLLEVNGTGKGMRSSKGRGKYAENGFEFTERLLHEAHVPAWTLIRLMESMLDGKGKGRGHTFTEILQDMMSAKGKGKGEQVLLQYML